MNPLVEIKKRGDIGLAPEQPLAHELKIVVRFSCAWREEQRLAETIDTACILDSGIPGDRLTESLRKIGMAGGPMQHAMQQDLLLNLRTLWSPLPGL